LRPIRYSLDSGIDVVCPARERHKYFLQAIDDMRARQHFCSRDKEARAQRCSARHIDTGAPTCLNLGQRRLLLTWGSQLRLRLFSALATAVVLGGGTRPPQPHDHVAFCGRLGNDCAGCGIQTHAKLDFNFVGTQIYISELLQRRLSRGANTIQRIVKSTANIVNYLTWSS